MTKKNKVKCILYCYITHHVIPHPWPSLFIITSFLQPNAEPFLRVVDKTVYIHPKLANTEDAYISRKYIKFLLMRLIKIKSSNI